MPPPKPISKPKPNAKPTYKKGGADGETPPESNRKLIITLGDISDIDGIMALRYYAENIDDKTDIAFVMNYPAYLGEEFDEPIKENEPGLGYKYGLKAYKEASDVSLNGKEENLSYQKILQIYELNKVPETNKPETNKSEYIQRWTKCLRDISYDMCATAWNTQNKKGKLYFVEGGINKINPFNAAILKNEILVYSKEFYMVAKSYKDTNLENLPSSDISFIKSLTGLNLKNYENIFMDMNGSAAFLDKKVLDVLNQDEVTQKLHSLHVMGGVYDDVLPATIVKIPGVLNRFSCSTMNQFYSPNESEALFNLFSNAKKPIYVVTNNLVSNLSNVYGNLENFYKDTLTTFNSKLIDNTIDLANFYDAYYNRNNGGKKPFDMFSAMSLIKCYKDPNATHQQTKYIKMHYNKKYGATFISSNDSPKIDDYIQTKFNEFAAQKDNFIKEYADVIAKPDDRLSKLKKLSFGLNNLTNLLVEQSELHSQSYESYNIINYDADTFNKSMVLQGNSKREGGARRTKSSKPTTTRQYTRTNCIHTDKRGKKRTIYTYKGKDYIKKRSSKTMKMYYSAI